MALPTLHTRRVTLRPADTEDAPFLVAHWGVACSGTISDTYVRILLARGAVDASQRGYGLFIVHDRATGEPIGACGLAHVDPLDEASLACSLDATRRHRGLATEACEALVDFGLKTCGLRRIVGAAAAANPAITRLWQRLGMKPWRVVDGTEYLALAPALLALPPP
jgi:hypothetical protein